MASTKFFKIITEKTIEQNMMHIPVKFQKIHGEELSKEILVNIPCGSKWKIGLACIDGQLYLQEGWPEFFKHYNILYGYLIFFKYLGNSTFEASIFNYTTMEIDYPKPPPIHQTMSKEKGQSSKQGERKSRTLDRIKSMEKFEALDKAKGFVNKPFFKVLMQPSYVKPKNPRLRIPAFFATDYLKSKSGSKIELRIPSGKSWCVKFTHHKLKNETTARFCGGWRTFVEENRLVVGDVCVFALTNHNKPIFDVTIHRANQDDDDDGGDGDSDNNGDDDTCFIF
ncbi:hypothetical protein CsatB_030698 [Cannabis sativa]